MLALTVHIQDPEDGVVYVTHQFWGESEEMCEDNKRAHADQDELLRKAIADGRTEEELEELNDEEWPGEDMVYDEEE